MSRDITLVVLARWSAKNRRLKPVPPLADEGWVVASAPSPRRSQHRLPPAEIEQLILDRIAGSEIRELARQYRVDRSTVNAHLRRAGVPERRAQGRTLTDEQIQEAGQLYASGLSLVAVGQWFDVDKRYLSRVLPQSGHALRRPGRR